MVKVLTVVGARPQFVKAAVVSRAISKSTGLEELIVHTGQHFDKNMSDVFFDEMQIPKPDFNLEINGLGHGAMTGKMLEGIEKILLDVKPTVVLVYGDTNSTLAGALAAKKLHIPVCHVEAGLRSFNNKMPEEINRILTDRISDLLFCPTSYAVKNLEKEGVGLDNLSQKVLQVGDVMLDAAKFYGAQAVSKSSGAQHVLVTFHRAENTDNEDRLRFICTCLNELSVSENVVFPIHPRTKQKLNHLGIKLEFETIDPVGYLDMVGLIKNAKLIVTDSGGLQKEAFFFNKYCITLREQTEWVELLDSEVNFLANSKSEFTTALHHISQKSTFPDIDLYGKGNAGELIVKGIIENFSA